MPELPEVETVRRGLEPVMSGARIVRAMVRRADLRFPFPDRFAERLTGATVRSVGRRAKYLRVLQLSLRLSNPANNASAIQLRKAIF